MMSSKCIYYTATVIALYISVEVGVIFRYATDFSPVLRGCSCYCCQHHTRAYVHHLLHTREILASTLLMMYVQATHDANPFMIFSFIFAVTTPPIT